MVNRDKSLTSSFKSGRLFLTTRYIYKPAHFVYGTISLQSLLQNQLRRSYLCFERSKTQPGKNVVIPLDRIVRLEKGNQYSWIPGGGMIIEVFVQGLDRVGSSIISSFFFFCQYFSQVLFFLYSRTDGLIDNFFVFSSGTLFYARLTHTRNIPHFLPFHPASRRPQITKKKIYFHKAYTFGAIMNRDDVFSAIRDAAEGLGCVWREDKLDSS